MLRRLFGTKPTAVEALVASLRPTITDPISVRDVFVESATSLLASQRALAEYDTHDPLSQDYSAGMRGRLCLQIRMKAAMVVAAAQKISAGKGQKIVSKWSAAEALLGRQATHFRIYERDLDHDLPKAMKLIGIHAPQLLAAQP